MVGGLVSRSCPKKINSEDMFGPMDEMKNRNGSMVFS